MPLEIKSALLCDMIREEKTGKFILIGVYGGDIIFFSKPAKFFPSFWVELVPYAQDTDIEIEIKIEVPGKKTPTINTIKASIARESTLLMAFNIRALEISDPGFLKLSMRAKGGRRWSEVLTKSVSFANPPLQSS